MPVNTRSHREDPNNPLGVVSVPRCQHPGIRCPRHHVVSSPVAPIAVIAETLTPTCFRCRHLLPEAPVAPIAVIAETLTPTCFRCHHLLPEAPVSPPLLSSSFPKPKNRSPTSPFPPRFVSSSLIKGFVVTNMGQSFGCIQVDQSEVPISYFRKV